MTEPKYARSPCPLCKGRLRLMTAFYWKCEQCHASYGRKFKRDPEGLMIGRHFRKDWKPPTSAEYFRNGT